MPLVQILFNMVEKQIAAICKNVRMSFSVLAIASWEQIE